VGNVTPGFSGRAPGAVGSGGGGARFVVAGLTVVAGLAGDGGCAAATNGARRHRISTRL